MCNWKERHQDELRWFDDATSSQAFCSQAFAFLFSKSNINWTCAAVVSTLMIFIYQSKWLLIVSLFLYTCHSFLSFEQRSQTSSMVVSGLHGNSFWRSHEEEFYFFSRPSNTPLPSPNHHHHHPSLGATRPSSPSSRVILFAPHLSVRLHLQDAVISLARLDVYCEAEIENGL